MGKKPQKIFLLGLLLCLEINFIGARKVYAEIAPSFVRNTYTAIGVKEFRTPLGVVVKDGIYVMDTDNDRVLKYDSSWNYLFTIGSTGSTSGKFLYPRTAAFDSTGNIYITDEDSNRVQKFTSSGTFITQWGSEGTGDGQFAAPTGIVIDSSNNVYVADCFNHRIQKFTSSGGFLAKWGSQGTGDSQFKYPEALAIDSSDNIYVADSENSRIQKFASSSGFLAKWGSVGTGNGQFNTPYGIAVDMTNNFVYVADTNNSRIQKFDLNGGYISQWGSDGTSDGQFQAVIGIGVDSSGNVYASDPDSNTVQVFNSSGTFLKKSGLDFVDGEFYKPVGVVFDSLGNFYVPDYNDRVQKFDSSGNFLAKWGSLGTGDGQFDYTNGITMDSSENIYVTDQYNYRVQKFDSSGNFLIKFGEYGTSDGAYFGDDGPGQIAYTSSNYLYVADGSNHCVRKFDLSGNYISKLGPTYDSGTKTLSRPRGVGVDSSGNVYVVDTDGNRVIKFDSSGNYVTYWGSRGSNQGQFRSPMSVGVDSLNNIYVADNSNHRVQKFNSSGTFLSTWQTHTSGVGTSSSPSGFGFSPLGNIYVSDAGYNNIGAYGSSEAPKAAISLPSFTNSTSFNIAISLTDSLEDASHLLMKVANSSDFSGSSWQAYVTSLPWTISSTEGGKSVYFQFKNRNGNTSSYQFNLTYNTLSPITDWKAPDGTPVIFATHSVNGVFSDNIYTEETFPTFNFTKAGASGADIDRYQILLTKAGDNGYTDKVYIDSINPNKPGDSDLREDSNLWTKYNGYDISVRNKKDSDKLTTGAYKWRVRVIDKAGNVTDTSEKILRIGTHEAVFSKGYFPLSILHIGGQNLNISTLNLSAVPSELNIWTKVPTFYGIAIPETKVKLTLTDTQDKTNIFKKETTANGEAKFGINIEKKDNLSSGIYLASLNATGQNGDYTEIPDFKLNVNVGNSEPLVQGAFIEESPEPEVSPTPGPTKKPQPTIVSKLPSSKTCLLFWCW